MQTFLPYADFEQTAKCLDYRRLGKQRVEAMQIYKAILLPDYGWQNHPAVNMWRGHLGWLARYYNRIVKEWVARGYRNNMPYMEHLEGNPPPWLGWDAFHISHRSKLLQKFPSHYSAYFSKETPRDLEYVWPVQK